MPGASLWTLVADQTAIHLIIHVYMVFSNCPELPRGLICTAASQWHGFPPIIAPSLRVWAQGDVNYLAQVWLALGAGYKVFPSGSCSLYWGAGVRQDGVHRPHFVLETQCLLQPLGFSRSGSTIWRSLSRADFPLETIQLSCQYLTLGFG